MIEVSDITVQFGGVTAIDALSARFNDPINGIIGPNGAGKTTLLNVMSGFVVPQTGAINVDGVNLLDLAPYKRARWGLRRSFQTEQIVDDLTAEENIRVMLDQLPLQRDEREDHLIRVLDLVGLSDKSKQLGSAMTMLDRRMTEIAKTLVGAPRIVMLDEPGGGLSAAEAERLRDTVLRIPDEFDVQVLLIDHDVDLIRAVCTETLVLDFGEKIAEGPTASVLEDPKVRAAYLGEQVEV